MQASSLGRLFNRRGHLSDVDVHILNAVTFWPKVVIHVGTKSVYQKLCSAGKIDPL